MYNPFVFSQLQGVDVVRLVDLTPLPREQRLGYGGAILLGMALSREFVLAMHRGQDPEREEYLEKEVEVENLADRLAQSLQRCGYRARSQSERANLAAGLGERVYPHPNLVQGVSALSPKAVARLAGLGFMGRNNLLVTRQYGCALTLCSVLTDAPLPCRRYELLADGCGTCSACVSACPAGALTGRAWAAPGNRNDLVDVSRCCCALSCMIACPWTLRYAHSLEEK